MLYLARLLSWIVALLSYKAHSLPPAVGAVRVYAKHDHGVTCYRIPAVIRTGAGTLLAFAEARIGGCLDSQKHVIAVRRSVDGGMTWSSITFAAGDDDHRVGNPYPIALSSGRVVLLYVKRSHPASPCIDTRVLDCVGQKKRSHPAGNGLVASDDDGVTWGSEVDVSEGFGAAKGNLPGPGSGIEVQIGAQTRRLLVVSHRLYNRGAFVTYSDDRGESWQTAPHWFPRMDEGTMADLGQGHILLNMRNAREGSVGRAVARSTDGGLTWSDTSFDKTLIGPVCEGSLAVMNGSVFFSNPASRTLRHHLTVRRSDDGGLTWPAQVVIFIPITGGYSSLVRGAFGDGTQGGILYESSTTGDIDFTMFNLNMTAR